MVPSYLLASICTSDSPQVLNVITPIIMTSLATMVLIIALSWMAAQFFKRPEYEGFASIEMHQLAVSIIMFITIFSGSCLAARIAGNFAGGDQFDIGRNYLSYISNQVSMPAVIKIQAGVLAAQYFGSWMMRWGPGVWSVNVPTFPSLTVVERVLDFLLMLISPFTASLMVQQAILEVVNGIMLPFVLPAGVVLRTFPPTRDAGAFLIAAALGFQLVFTFSYVMHDSVVRTMVANTTGSMKDAEQVISTTYGAPEVAKYIGETRLFSFNDLFFHPLIALSFLLFQAVFLPALSISLTIAFIKGTTKFISQKLN